LSAICNRETKKPYREICEAFVVLFVDGMYISVYLDF